MNALTRPALAADWNKLALRYRRQLLVGSALLVRLGLSVLIAWAVGIACSLLLAQPSTLLAPWQFELFGWLELVQITDGWALAACYFGLVGWYSVWWHRRASHTLALSDGSLRFSARGRVREFSAEQIRSLRPLPPALAWIKLAFPRIRPNLLSAPHSLDDWFELCTKNNTWLFVCSDAATSAQLRKLAHSQDGDATAPAAVPIWRTLLILALLALLIALPGLTITLAILYAAWRLVLAILRKCKRAAWERAARRIGGEQTTPAVTPSAIRKLAWLRWPEAYIASLLLFPLRMGALLLRHAAALLRLVPWRGLRIALGDGLVYVLLLLGALLPAGLIGFGLASASSYSQTSPTLARLLLARTAPSRLPLVATQALERAMQNGNRASMRAVLLAGAHQGVFRLSGYQAAKRRAQICRDAVPLELTKDKVVLDETPSMDELIFAARCARNPKHLQLELGTAAFQRQAGAKLDVHRALASGNPDLVSFALDQGADLEQRDWRGRTPLLAALDLLSTSRPEERQHALLMVLALGERGATLSAQDHAQRSAALIAAATDLPAPLFEHMLAATPAQARSALGATVLHAAAASGDVARARQIVARGTPTAALTADGRSALHFAKGRAMVWYLIDLGLDAELPDARGQTPFHHAVIRRDLAAARVLGGLAADKSALDIFGRSALDYAPGRPKAAADDTQNKTAKTASKRKQNEPKPEWLQWRELADLLQGHRL